MSRRYILPFGKPIISYEPTVDHLTGIIASDFEKYKHAFYNNFIDILIDNAADFYELRNWMRYDFLEFHKLPRRIVFGLEEKEIINILCSWLSQKHYILVSFETYYVSQYPSYQKSKFRHYAMILGFDKEKEVFICGDFFDYTYYSIEECSMHEVIQAIIHNGDFDAKGFAKDFTLLRIDEVITPKLDINKIIMSIEMLLGGNNKKIHRQYGLNIFDRMCEMISEGNISEHKNEFKRHAHFIYVHMEAMIMRVNYIKKIKGDAILEEICKSIIKSKNIIEQYRNYVLKLIITMTDEFPQEHKEKYIDRLMCVKAEYYKDVDRFKNYLLSIDANRLF